MTKFAAAALLFALLISFTLFMGGQEPVPKKEFTVEQLSKFDGKDGRKAYIAIDGVVYDVSESRAWKNGKHKGNKAGQDLSKMIKRSPHGKSVLGKLKPVGRLKGAKK
jgi:predicted heme/steroid binding protein